MHVLVFIAVAAIWGASFLFMKQAAVAFGPLTIGFLRLSLGAVTLAIIALGFSRMRRSWRPHGRQWGWLSVLVITSYAWPYCLQPWLVARNGSGFIGMMVAFVPLLTIAVSLPILGRRPSRRELVGVLGGLACLWLIIDDGRARAVPLWDLLLAISVPSGYALGNTLVKARFPNVPTLPFTGWCLMVAAAMVSVPMWWWDPAPIEARIGEALLPVFLIGVPGTGLAIAGLYWLIQREGPLWAGMVAYVVPVGAVFWGWVDGEIVTTTQILAISGVLSMVALVQRRPPPRATSASEESF